MDKIRKILMWLNKRDAYKKIKLAKNKEIEASLLAERLCLVLNDINNFDLNEELNVVRIHVWKTGYIYSGDRRLEIQFPNYQLKPIELRTKQF